MERPGLAVAVAVLALVFGVLGLCALPASMSMYFVDFGPPNPAVEIVKSNQFLFIWTMGTAALGMVLIIVEIVGAIGLLMMKPWGRLALMGYSVCALVMVVLGLAVNSVFLFMPLAEMGGPEAIGGVAGGLCGSCFGVVFPIGFLVALTRPQVVEAYTE